MKKSNKGFSLVELIIVIAIMAILVAVLAPQYLQYVEKTKKSTDADAFGKVVSAVEIAVADPTVMSTSTSVTVTWDGSAFAITAVDSSDVSALQAEVNKVINGDDSNNDLVAKSKAFAAAPSSAVTFTIDSDGNWTKSYAGAYAEYVTTSAAASTT